MPYFDILDLLSLFILIGLAFLVYFRRMLRFNINMYYLYHIIVIIFAVICSMAITYLTKEFETPNPVLIYTLSSLYLFIITATYTIPYVICRSIANNDIKLKSYFVPILTTAICAALLIVVPFINHSDAMLGILINNNHLYYILNAVQMVNIVLGIYYVVRYYKNFNIYTLIVVFLGNIFLIISLVVTVNTNNFHIVCFLISVYLLLAYIVLTSSVKEYDKDVSLISEEKLSKMVVKAIVEDEFTFVLGPIHSHYLGKFVAADADLRFVDKNFGPIAPLKIREIAIKRGYIFRIEKISMTKTLDYILRNPDMMKEINWIVICVSNFTLESPEQIGELVQMVISKKVPTRQIAFVIQLETDEKKIKIAKYSTRRLESMGFKVMFDFVHSPNRSFNILVQHSDSYIIINNEILERLYSKDEGEVSSELVKDFVEVLDLKFIVSYISDENQRNVAYKHNMNLMCGNLFCRHLHEKQFNEFIKLNNKVEE